jgi:AraC-like DNA-binding protein/mannose-6-phosphate isomerase-like protein (cupin superfamily)
MMTEYSFTSPRRYPHHREPDGLHTGIAFNQASTGPLDVHIHREMEVGLVLAGEERIEFSDYQFSCGPGEVWLCGMQEPHRCARRANTRTVIMMFQPDAIGEELLGEMPWLTLFALPPAQRPQVSSPETRRRMLEIGYVLRREIEEKRLGWRGVVHQEVLRLLLELRRGWDILGLVETPRYVQLSALARVMPAFNLAYNLPRRCVSAVEAAGECGMSAGRFRVLFRRTVGMTFRTFCLRARLSYAAQRLVSTDRPLTAVAEEAGFVDRSHLHRCFVKAYGRTPSQYRKRRKAAASEARPPQRRPL